MAKNVVEQQSDSKYETVKYNPCTMFKVDFQ